MTPTVRLLLLPLLLLGMAAGEGLEEKKGPLEKKILEVHEQTPVPYPIYQFHAANPDVNGFRLSGDDEGSIRISPEGWLYLERALDWDHVTAFTVEVEALVGDEPVEGPATVTIVVLDINNHAPKFNQTDYPAVIREGHRAGEPFARVFATDLDDPKTPNADLSYSLVKQIPNQQDTLFFQVNSVTGEISTTEKGQRLLKAREAIQYTRGETHGSSDILKKKFDEFCTPTADIPYELNPFYSCVQRAELRRLNPLEDPDFTLIVRVQDLGGGSEKALSTNARVNVAVQPNLWVPPATVFILEHLERTYPMTIAHVQSNDPSALFRLLQKERMPRFPFAITEEGEIQLTEQLDREEKNMYILVVLAEDEHGNELEPPLEFQVVVQDVNDNPPQCAEEESVFEVQENEPTGSRVGQLLVHDNDDPATPNAMLTYKILSQSPSASTFQIDDATGLIQSLQIFRRKDAAEYRLTVQVHDPAFSTECRVLIKVIDINNELPIFEQNNYGSLSLSEDTPVGFALLTVKATDADDPGTGSSQIQFHVSAGNDDGVFSMETGPNGEGRLIVVKPLDFESSSFYQLRIDARNPEPLMAGLDYGIESSASVSVSVKDVDEAPEFSLDILDVTVPENTSVGATLLTVEAKDPEGKEIEYKLSGESRGWLEIDPASGEIKTKAKLDREVVESLQFTVTASEKGNLKQSTEREVSVHLLDVNDNTPKLTETWAFICAKKPQPVVLTAHDGDSAPFSQPFTFALAQAKKSPNWELRTVDGKSATLTLKKTPSEDKTFLIPINIKDNAGLGVTQKFEVRVCNCTALGSCYTEPGTHSFKLGLPATIGILGGTIAFVFILLAIALHRIKKDNEKKALEAGNLDPLLK
ncbi:cadherin-17 [Aplochiton taeniatus]